MSAVSKVIEEIEVMMGQALSERERMLMGLAFSMGRLEDIKDRALTDAKGTPELQFYSGHQHNSRRWFNLTLDGEPQDILGLYEYCRSGAVKSWVKACELQGDLRKHGDGWYLDGVHIQISEGF